MSAGSTLRLRWAGQHEALILPGTVVRIGRPHPGAPPDFIGLTGAPEVVNRVMLVVDNTSETVILTRLPDANAVHVGAMLVQPGGRQSPTLPARLTLANNGLELRLERVV